MRFCCLLAFATSLYGAHLVYQKPISAGPMAVDPAGNIYVYVLSNSTIVKLDPDGNQVYSKPMPIGASRIAVDGAGNVVLVGTTTSDTLPTTPGVFQPKRSPGTCITGDRAMQPYPCQDAYVGKLDANGNLAWLSYLGGLNTDIGESVGADASGNVYVVGLTMSADFPVMNPFQPSFGGYADAFITKISPDGTRILYSSTFGGDEYDLAWQIALDQAGNAYVAGVEEGDPSQAFLIKVSASGSLVYANYLSTPTTYTEGTTVTVDSAGNAYLGGFTNAKNFPTTAGSWNGIGPGAFYTDFVAKYSANGSGPVYVAQFSGSSAGVGAIAIDSKGDAYLAGAAEWAGIPIVGPAMEPCSGPSTLFFGFLIELNADGSAPLYSSYDEDSAMALAPDGSLILLGSTLRKITDLATPDDPYLATACVLNGASFVSHTDVISPGVSPGEVVTLKGTGLGPIVPGLDGVQVTFDGVPGTLLYAQDAQINVVAPYEIAGRTQTAIQVQYAGKSTPPVTIPVSATSPAFFDSPDGTTVARGSSLTFHLTGGGQTAPASVDGQIWQTTGGLAAPVTATLTTYGPQIVTADIPVTYAGPIPGWISAAQEITVQIPADLPDSFVTPQYSVGSYLAYQIGGQKVTVQVIVK